LRIVVSNDSIKKATATSHGSIRLIAADGAMESEIIAVKNAAPYAAA
jgi:hypothetical protein